MGDGCMGCAWFDKNTGTCNGGNWSGGKANPKPDSYTKKHYCLGNDYKYCKHHFQNRDDTSIQKKFDSRAFEAKSCKWFLIVLFTIFILTLRPDIFWVLFEIFLNILDSILDIFRSFLY